MILSFKELTHCLFPTMLVIQAVKSCLPDLANQFQQLHAVRAVLVKLPVGHHWRTIAMELAGVAKQSFLQ